MKKIIAFRHSQKTDPNADGTEPITAYGAMQIFAAALVLPLGLIPRCIIHSGVPRARQCAEIIRAALQSEAPLEVDIGLDIRPMFQQFDPKQALAEIHAARTENDSVLTIVRKTAYGQAARQRITETLLRIARQTDERGEETALVVSHSPYIELAANGTGTEKIPGGLYEADAIIYEIDNGVIIRSTYLAAPIKGDRI